MVCVKSRSLATVFKNKSVAIKSKHFKNHFRNKVESVMEYSRRIGDSDGDDASLSERSPPKVTFSEVDHVRNINII